MEVLVGMALLIATVKNLVDLVRRVTARDYIGAATQAAAYVVGFLVAWLFSNTPFAAGIDVGVPLYHASLATLVVAGLTIGASAGFTKDVIKAVDQHQTEAVPPLGG